VRPAGGAYRFAMTPPLLSIAGLVVRYGAVAAVRGVDLDVAPGEAVAIVGPNGAGKSSLLAAIAGTVGPAAGSLLFEEKPLERLALENVVRAGVALVPEGRRIFATLSVEENLRLGATPRRDRAAVRADVERQLAAFPILRERRRQPAGQLSGGEQQQLAIARALLSRPKLLMLDEPSLGLAPRMVEQVYALLRDIRAGGVAILLVEQNAERAFALADRAIVMSGGEFRLAGAPGALAADARFDAAYFGLPAAAGAPSPP
jgi:branched-chain amino acid transport system ATP-binding protein